MFGGRRASHRPILVPLQLLGLVTAPIDINDFTKIGEVAAVIADTICNLASRIVFLLKITLHISNLVPFFIINHLKTTKLKGLYSYSIISCAYPPSNTRVATTSAIAGSVGRTGGLS